MKRAYIVIPLLLTLLFGALIACGESTTAQTTTTATDSQQTQDATPTDSSTTDQPTPTPTQAESPLPSVSEVNQLLSARDGQVTALTPTQTSDTTGLGIDVQVNNPTQARIKHINFLLFQYFLGVRSDVTGGINIYYHANGYTGADDPIASCGGVPSEYSAGLDENQLWSKMQGVFNVDLSA